MSNITLQILKRKPEWLRMYPRANYWATWHSLLISHNSKGPIVPTTVAELNTLWVTNQLRTRGAEHLKRFEERTLLGKLPASTLMPRALLLEIGTHVISHGLAAWHDLRGHYASHGQGSEQPVLDAAAQALRSYVATIPGLSREAYEPFFLGRVDDEASYGMLAVATFALPLLDTPDPPFDFYLYCPDAPEKHALSISLEIPASFIRKHAPGQPAGQGVRVGVTVARAEHFPYSAETLSVPHLNPAYSISTAFAPETKSMTQLRRPGFGTKLNLR